MKRLTSKDNPFVKSVLRLSRSARARREEDRIVLDGVHLVGAYLERFGTNGVEAAVKQSALEHPEVRALGNRVPALTLADALFDHAAPVKSPLGILALAPRPRVIGPNGDRRFQVLLDDVQDPGNVGTILRSAAAAGAGRAHLSKACADPWSPKALRAGMGAQFLIPIEEHDDLAAAAAGLGGKLIACTADATLSVFDADLKGEIAFVIGGEGAGISPQILREAHERVRIPMQPGIESLNAGAAAAICFYERARQAAGEGRNGRA
jgi:RNA methyltransferase, TrmH family